MTDYKARELRAVKERCLLESESLDKAVDRLSSALSRYQVKWSICGGMAVQHWGYYRSTQDVDIVVDNFARARLALMDAGYDEFVDDTGYFHDRFVDPQTGRIVDLIQGGQKLAKTDKVPTPSLQLACDWYSYCMSRSSKDLLNFLFNESRDDNGLARFSIIIIK